MSELAQAMEDNLEVYFCDLCNTSVPQRDLETKVAMRVKGRVLGSCCLGEIRGQRTPAASPAPARSGFAGIAVVMLAAVASAAVFLDWRLSEEIGSLEGQIQGLETQTRESRNRLRGLEERLGATATGAQITGTQDAVAALGETLGLTEARLQAVIEDNRELTATLDRKITSLKSEQGRQLAGVETLQGELRELGTEVAAALARPIIQVPVSPSFDSPVEAASTPVGGRPHAAAGTRA